MERQISDYATCAKNSFAFWDSNLEYSGNSNPILRAASTLDRTRGANGVGHFSFDWFIRLDGISNFPNHP